LTFVDELMFPTGSGGLVTSLAPGPLITSDFRANPYVGLRPFEVTDSLFFFGRRELVVTLLEQLHRTRLLPVVGSSGCGKSSIVRAGLVPAVLAGFLVHDRDDWSVVTLKPGQAPLENLAAALLGPDNAEARAVRALVDRMLEQPLGAVLDVIRPRLGPRKNLLLLVDQFEEIFAFRGDDDDDANEQLSKDVAARREEAAEFVALLLALAAREALPVYVVLTMRSDFIGDCDVFAGLPEALTVSQHLVPRLTRTQLRQAIEGPALLKVATLAPRLLDRLLNDAGDRTDQLPVLQHALMRTWQRWLGRGATGPVEQADYEATGGVATALARHADEAFETLDPALCARVFKCLTESDARGRRVRRPSTLGELAALCAAPPNRLEEVLERFRADGRHFVVIGSEAARDDRRVEIAHESLIRQWPRLRAWVDEERDARDQLKDLVRRAQRWSRGEGDLLHGPDLALGERWRRALDPSAAWAARHGCEGQLALVFEYLERSRREHARQLWRRWLLIGAFVIGLMLFALGAWWQKGLAERAAEVAIAAEQRANDATEQARNEAARAKRAAEEALAASERAHVAEEEAQARRTQAEDASSVAREEAARAERAARQARDASLIVVAEGMTTSREDAVSILREVRDPTTSRWAHAALDTLRVLISPERILEASKEAPPVVAGFSPDGTHVVAVSSNNAVTLWNTVGRLELQSPARGERTMLIARAADGQTFASAHENLLRLWSLDGGAPLELTGHEGDITALAFSPDGRQVLTSSYDRTLRIWSRNGQSRVIGHDLSGWITAVGFNPSGESVVWGLGDGIVRLGKLDSLEEAIVVGRHRTAISVVAFSGDGKQIASGSQDDTVQVWNADSSGQAEATWWHSAPIRCLAFSPDGKAVVSASVDGVIRVWQTGDYLQVVRGHTDAVTSLEFSPDGQRIVSSGLDGKVRLWNMGGPGRPRVVQGVGRAVSFSPDGARVLVAGTDGNFSLQVRDVDAPSRSREIGRHDGPIHAATFSPDGSRIASGSWDETVRVWTTDGSNEPVTLRGHQDNVFAVAFTPDGKRVVSGSGDRTVRVWNIEGSGKETILQGHDGSVFSVAASHDGRRVASGSADHTIRVWNSDGTGDPVVLKGHQGDVLAVTFAPDGRHLVSGSADKGVRLWDVSGRQPSKVIGQHQASVRAVVFTHAGQRVASASRDHTVGIWRIDGVGHPLLLRHPADLLAMAVSRDDRQLALASADNTYLWHAYSRAPIFSNEQLLDALWKATDNCLSPADRQNLLGEAASASVAGNQRCQHEVAHRKSLGDTDLEMPPRH
jgi:WD40 repeat protein